MGGVGHVRVYRFIRLIIRFIGLKGFKVMRPPRAGNHWNDCRVTFKVSFKSDSQKGLGFRVGFTWDSNYLQFYGFYLLYK